MADGNLSPEEIKKTVERATADVRPKKGSANGGSVSPEPKGSKQPLHDWVSPDWSILDDRRGELPDFPLECLSSPVRAWVGRAAQGAGVTVAHVAVPALGIASSLVGMARRLWPTGSAVESCSPGRDTRSRGFGPEAMAQVS